MTDAHSCPALAYEAGPLGSTPHCVVTRLDEKQSQLQNLSSRQIDAGTLETIDLLLEESMSAVGVAGVASSPSQYDAGRFMRRSDVDIGSAHKR